MVAALLQPELVESLGLSSSSLAVLLFVTTFVNIIVVIFVGPKIGKDIGDRVEIVTENVARFRRHEKLHYLEDGDDEMAQLDRSFHEMAAALNEAIDRERDLVDNAASIICAITGELQLQAINPAVEKLLGHKPDQLIGSSVLELAIADGQELLVETLYQVRYSGTETTLELPLHTASGAVIQSYWMIKWSKEKNTWICMIQDISQRKIVEAMKQQMVNMVSHDLRTPLSTIQVIFALLQSNRFGAFNAKGIELLISGERACKQLLNLTNDLLALDRLEAGKVDLEYIEVELDHQFRNIVSVMEAVAEKQHIKLQYQESGLKLVADGDRLDQMMTNLIANAIKFSHPNGVVLILASQKGAFIEIVVQDHGVGISDKHLPFIFDRFQQVRVSDAKEKKGSGLGLAIVKALVELHGGSVGCVSEVGQGSSFYLRLPVKELPPKQVQADGNVVTE
jgi:PAS domain S-box-containing protein